jgi:hypothetical protein
MVNEVLSATPEGPEESLIPNSFSQLHRKTGPAARFMPCLRNRNGGSNALRVVYRQGSMSDLN